MCEGLTTRDARRSRDDDRGTTPRRRPRRGRPPTTETGPPAAPRGRCRPRVLQFSLTLDLRRRDRRDGPRPDPQRLRPFRRRAVAPLETLFVDGGREVRNAVRQSPKAAPPQALE